MFVNIVVIIIGVYFLVFYGLLGRGLSWGRTKKYMQQLGTGLIRIIYAAVGAAFIIYGILAILK